MSKKADYLLAVKGNQPGLQSVPHARFGLARRQALERAGQSAQCAEQSRGRFVWQGF